MGLKGVSMLPLGVESPYNHGRERRELSGGEPIGAVVVQDKGDIHISFGGKEVFQAFELSPSPPKQITFRSGFASLMP